MSAVLFHTGPVVDQHELERFPVEPGLLDTESTPGGVIEELPVPAAIGGPRLLERLVGTSDIGCEVLTLSTSPSGDKAADEQQNGKYTYDDENDC